MLSGAPRVGRGLPPRIAAFGLALLLFGFGQELWARYLPAYLRTLGGSVLLIGALGSLQDLLDAAYAYPGGALSDRLGSRKALLCFGAATSAGLLVYLLAPSIVGIFAGALLVAAWTSLGLPATFALIGEELPRDRRISGFTLQAVVKRLPIVVAPPLGGLLLESVGLRRGMHLGFAVALLLSIAALAVLAVVFRETPRAKVPTPASPEGPAGKAGRSAVRLGPTLKRLLAADCLIRFCEGLPEVFLVVWALETVRISPVQFGLLQSVLTATAILSYLPAATLARRSEKKPFVVLTFLFFALFPLAVFLSRSFWQLAAAYALGGLREIGEPARKALIVDLADPAARGRVVGLYYGIRGFAVSGAAAVGGLLWTLRPALTFGVAALLGAAGTLWSVVSLPRRPATNEMPA